MYYCAIRIKAGETMRRSRAPSSLSFKNNADKNNKEQESIPSLSPALSRFDSTSSFGSISENLLSLSSREQILLFTNTRSQSNRPSVPMASSAIQRIFKTKGLDTAAIPDEKVEGVVHSLGIYYPERIRHELAKSLMKEYEGSFLFSENIIKLKSCDENVIRYYVELLKIFVIDNNKCDLQKIVICSVPSSKEQSSHGITKVAHQLAEETGNINGTNILIRTVDKQPFSAGTGKRSLENASLGLKVCDPGVQDKTILLLDDVCTTGSSMSAVKLALERSGAARVVCLALGYTYNQNFKKSYTASPLVEALLNYIEKQKEESDPEYALAIKDSYRLLEAKVPVIQFLRPNSQVNAIVATSSSQFLPRGCRLGSLVRGGTQSVVGQCPSSFIPPRSIQFEAPQTTLIFNDINAKETTTTKRERLDATPTSPAKSRKITNKGVVVYLT